MLLDQWFFLSDVHHEVDGHGSEKDGHDDDADDHSHHRAAVVAVRGQTCITQFRGVYYSAKLERERENDQNSLCDSYHEKLKKFEHLLENETRTGDCQDFLY